MARHLWKHTGWLTLTNNSSILLGGWLNTGVRCVVRSSHERFAAKLKDNCIKKVSQFYSIMPITEIDFDVLILFPIYLLFMVVNFLCFVQSETVSTTWMNLRTNPSERWQTFVIIHSVFHRWRLIHLCIIISWAQAVLFIVSSNLHVWSPDWWSGSASYGPITNYGCQWRRTNFHSPFWSCSAKLSKAGYHTLPVLDIHYHFSILGSCISVLHG